MIKTYEEYKKVRAEYSVGDKTIVHNEILGFKPFWFVKFYKDNNAIVEKNGVWYVQSDQPVGIIYSSYRGDKHEKQRIHGTFNDIKKEISEESDATIEFLPLTYMNFLKWEKNFRYGSDKFEKFDRDAIDSLVEEKSIL